MSIYREDNRCSYDVYTRARPSLRFERCPYQRHDDTPYCYDHGVRVSWLSLEPDRMPVQVVEPVYVQVTPWWATWTLALLLWFVTCSMIPG